MAKLPYTITICPDEPNPKQFTALTPSVVRALRYTNDLTIDQRQYMWPSTSSDFEGKLRELVNKKEKNT